MTISKPYSLGYSSCPNDTFIFKAIANQLIDLKGFNFDIKLGDVESLNQKAYQGLYDITKLSIASFGLCMDKYALLKTGSALGKKCGPLVVSLPKRILTDKKKPVIAVPGLGTSAYFLFIFYINDLFEGMDIKIVPMTFNKIMPSILTKKVDFGIIIHEGRFVYQDMGLELKIDLGEWWEKKTSLPIPLGGIAIKRDIAPKIMCDIQSIIKQSIEHAHLHPDMAYDYIKDNAQEIKEEVIKKHIELYVNDFSKDLEEKGEACISLFLQKALSAGLIKNSKTQFFAC